MQLIDLTKAELLQLINKRFFQFSKRDILTVRWNTITNKAKTLADEACLEMKNYHGPENYTKWKAANNKFDSAMRLYSLADQLFEKINNKEKSDG